MRFINRSQNRYKFLTYPYQSYTLFQNLRRSRISSHFETAHRSSRYIRDILKDCKEVEKGDDVRCGTDNLRRNIIRNQCFYSRPAAGECSPTRNTVTRLRDERPNLDTFLERHSSQTRH